MLKSNLPCKKVVISIDWTPGVFRSDVYCVNRHYTTKLEDYGDWSIVVEFSFTGVIMANFLVYDNAPQQLLVPGFHFDLHEGARKVGVATVKQEISTISSSRCAYTKELMKLPIKEQREEVAQFILDMLDWHNQTDEEQFYIDLLNICGALK